MNLLPFEAITYRTTLNQEEVIRRLTDAVEPVKMFRFHLFDSGPEKLYEGEINGQQFTIKRILRFNFFNYQHILPEIRGKIQQANDEATITVDMQLHPFATASIYILIGGFGLTCIAMLLILITDHEFSSGGLAILGMLLVGYLVPVWSFKVECGTSKQHLQELFEGEIITKNNTYS